MKKHCIYAFIDISGKPFYVGKTYNIKKRMQEHWYEIRYGSMLPKYNKLRKLLKENEDKKINDFYIILEDDIESDISDEREIFWIAKLREDGYNLKNLTDGGEGGISTIPGLSEKLSKIHTGSKRSEQAKMRMSESRKGMKFSEEHKNNLSIARKKRITTIETRQKASKTSKGKINIKIYKLISPDGMEHTTSNGLTVFCEEHNLNLPNLMKVLKGERRHSKGWKIEKI